MVMTELIMPQIMDYCFSKYRVNQKGVNFLQAEFMIDIKVKRIMMYDVKVN